MTEQQGAPGRDRSRVRRAAVPALLVLAALARTAAAGGAVDPRDPRPAVLAATGLAIAVPAVLAVLLVRRSAGAPAAVVGLGAVGAGLLVRTGLQLAAGDLPADVTTVLAASAAAAQAFAAGLVVAGWQDAGGPRRARVAPRTGALVGALGLLVATGVLVRQAAVVTTGPGGAGVPVALAESPSASAAAVALAVLAATWWGAGLVDRPSRHGLATGVAAGALVELATTLALAATLGFLPVASAVGAAAALVLGVVPLPDPVGRRPQGQVNSSSA